MKSFSVFKILPDHAIRTDEGLTLLFGLVSAWPYEDRLYIISPSLLQMNIMKPVLTRILMETLNDEID